MIVKKWLRDGAQLLLGICAGAILTVVSVLAAAPLLFTAATAIGPIIALGLYTVIVVVVKLRNRPQRVSHGTIRFLAGMAIIPVYGAVILLDWLLSQR
ncbi:hypothetical protein [Nocardia heshunensis]